MSKFTSDSDSKPTRLGKLGLWVVGAIFVLISPFNLWEHLNADEILVIQSPISGTLTWSKSPGVKWQGFGKVTKYKKRSQFWFSAKSDQGSKMDESIKARFNDGGHAQISGSIAWEMPLDDEHLTQLHTKYGSHEAIQYQLVRTVVERSVYMTGPLMSSKESSAERRNDLLQYIEDQVQNGVFRTETTQERQTDQMTGQPKTVNVVKLIVQNGQIVRSDESPLKTFGIRTFNPSINEVKYDDKVGEQIQEQQRLSMDVQTAIANARKAEQAAITAEKDGQAKAATAKWEQEVVKAKEVTAAEMRKAVAKLDAEAAQLTKQKETLLGEGEAARRRLVMQADGALDKKLNVVLEINKYYADAIKNHAGPWVSSIVMGNTSGNVASAPGGAAIPMIELLTMKAARDLGLDLAISGRENTKK